jgi:uncharacterized membrane protein YccF (DUF307 family)
MIEQSGTGAVRIERQQPGCFVTVLYFVFIGWWLSALWTAAAWFLIALILTMPIGLLMINRLPMIATLRQPSTELRTTIEGTVVAVQETGIPQHPFFLRALYFILIGWWFSGFWLTVAWIASITLIGLPLAIWMYNRVPAITTLRRY